jgi:hypothetical protein
MDSEAPLRTIQVPAHNGRTMAEQRPSLQMDSHVDRQSIKETLQASRLGIFEWRNRANRSIAAFGIAGKDTTLGQVVIASSSQFREWLPLTCQLEKFWTRSCRAKCHEKRFDLGGDLQTALRCDSHGRCCFGRTDGNQTRSMHERHVVRAFAPCAGLTRAERRSRPSMTVS